MIELATMRRDVALLSAVFVFFMACPAGGACVAPRYRVGRVLENAAADVSLQISIRLEDFAPERLVCLAGALRQKYPDRSVWVAMFSAHDAAQEYSPQTIEVTRLTIYDASKLHGFFVYDKEKRDDYLLIVPDGRRLEMDSPFNTRINLPVAGEPACGLAMKGRCLLEFQDYIDPLVSDKASASGDVTVAGRIGRNGVPSELRAVDAKADSPDGRSVFTDRAIQNLRTWRFEPGGHVDDIRIRYHFEVTDTPPPGAGNVQIRPPDEVIIQTGRTR